MMTEGHWYLPWCNLWRISAHTYTTNTKQPSKIKATKKLAVSPHKMRHVV